MKNFCIKFLVLVLLVMVVVSSNTTEAATRNPYIQKFFELYNIIHNYKVSQMMPYGENKTLGYFSPEGVPYHAFETFLCEAPDYGHETTSETYSYYLWLEAMYFKLTYDYTPFRTALQSMDNYIIPGAQDQPVWAANNDKGTITSGRYAKQSTTVTDYPVLMYQYSGAENEMPRLDDPSKTMEVPVYYGDDFLAKELTSKYNNKYVYGMHWLLDTDNFFGFGYQGNTSSTRKTTYLATCERGGAESSWATIPHPNWKDHNYGNNTAGDKGFADIFLNSSFGWKPEYSYSVATDADARAIQAAYMAAKVLEKTRPYNRLALNDLSAKMGKMGNFLRYGLRTKYFLPLGMKFTQTIEPIYDSNPARSKYNHRITVHNPDVAKNPEKNVHYLLGWNYAWGAAINSPTTLGQYPWRIGDDNVHAGYQNPMAAYALSKYDYFKNELTSKIDLERTVLGLKKTMPTSEGGVQEWSKSLNRQLELIRWLQSAEGAIGGGVTNCWNGNYSDPNLVWDPNPPIPTPTADDLHNLANYRQLPSSDSNYRRSFYGMYYTDSPVYFGQDPTKLPGEPGFRNPDGDSNAWFGWQVWLMQRLAELYLEVDNSDPLKTKLETILKPWITWAISKTQLNPADPAASIKLPGALVWSGQPDSDWAPASGNALPPANTGYHVDLKKDGSGNEVYYVDTSVAGNLARTCIYYAAGGRKHGNTDATVVASRNMAQQILDLLYANYKDERGYANEYRSTAFVNNFFNAKVYVPGSRLDDGSPEMVKRTGLLPAGMGMHKTGSRYGNVFSTLDSSNDPRNVNNYMTYDQIRARFEENPGPQGAKDISYTKLLNARNGVNNDDPDGDGNIYPADPDEDPNGVTIRWHRFFSQVEIALAFAEFGIYFGDEAEPRDETTWGPLTIDKNAAAKYGVYGSAHTDFHDRAKLYITKSTNNEPSTYGQIGVGKDSSSDPQMILGYQSYVGNVICGQPKLWVRGPVRLGDVLAGYDIDWSQGSLLNESAPRIVMDNLCKDNPSRDLGFLNYSFDESKCYASNNDSDNITVNSGQSVEKWNGLYKNISVGSNGRLTFKGGGVFYCNNFTTEPGAILDFDTSTNPVIIIAKGNLEIKSRTQMNVTNDDASKLLIITASQNQVYLAPDSKWRGTIFAPKTGYLNVDLGFKADVKGAFIGKSVVIHQSTDIFQVPFNYSLLTTSLPGYRHTPPSSASAPSSGSGSGSSWNWWNWSW